MKKQNNSLPFGTRGGSNLYLTGFMGSGKTTVAKLLAKRLGKQLIDLDQWIEMQEKKSIPEIFEKKGEAQFRKIELLVLKKVSRSKGVIVSLGGGTLLNKRCQFFVKKTGSSFYLKCSQLQLANRLKGKQSSRPLLFGIETRSALKLFIKKHMASRKQSYETSDFHINVTNLSAMQTAIKIESIWKNECL